MAKTTVQRGYGREHRKLRARWAKVVTAGDAYCARCSRPIWPGDPWELDHDDHDRSIYLRPSHAYCNRRAGAVKLNALRRRRSTRWRKFGSRVW